VHTPQIHYRHDGDHRVDDSRICYGHDRRACIVRTRPSCLQIHSLVAPRSESANKTLANLLPGTFAPGALLLPGTLAPWNLRSQERNGTGTFVPLVHDVDTRYSNYALLLMRTFSIERCSAHGLSLTLIRRPCSG